MKKVIFSAALLMAAATFSFAGNPKETKEAKAETPTEVKSEVTLSTYYVVGISGSNYLLDSSPSPDCNTAPFESPCKITSTTAITSGLAPKTQVDNETNGFDVIDRQPQL
ncbi:hypothetical protein [Pedobacter panaciterrae]